ncbi:hypothetical protein P152DRAFT_288616 [Eremomyces bilateralis CBS 781.70]|uniref:Uncharacterized protein n=1 Tax=Eremomyces bilateralis CBS 781.70 TaxID=1392243 RepID=A0A6G1G6K4_9PEZI|nr:uncharacterized protein P152DRAFT_288616 [Eremomyces bilateralis CBS 781.70]KAF1813683.1 hypothetical protein P152DRAFT_288616 [Eremomyces bilateralis CBS 781.70]
MRVFCQPGTLERMNLNRFRLGLGIQTGRTKEKPKNKIIILKHSTRHHCFNHDEMCLAVEKGEELKGEPATPHALCSHVLRTEVHFKSYCSPRKGLDYISRSKADSTGSRVSSQRAGTTRGKSNARRPCLELGSIRPELNAQLIGSPVPVA